MPYEFQKALKRSNSILTLFKNEDLSIGKSVNTRRSGNSMVNS